MTLKEQKEFFERFTKRMADVMLKKGNDYAGDDRLSNFKQVGAITGSTAALACLNLIATKVARLGQLLRGKVPNNESIEDNIVDLANYSVLLAMIEVTPPELYEVVVKSPAYFTTQYGSRGLEIIAKHKGTWWLEQGRNLIGMASLLLYKDIELMKNVSVEGWGDLEKDELCSKPEKERLAIAAWLIAVKLGQLDS